MKKPKIVVFDLETIWDSNEWMREDRAFAMSNWEGRTMKADINSIITLGYKVNNEPAASISVWDFAHYDKSLLNDDYEICAFAYELLNDADAIITHNGKRFDWKFLKTRMKKHGLPRLDKIPHIDTCAVAKQNYSLFSNRLKDLTQFLGVSSKISTGGKNLWTRIYQGDEEAQEEMAIYCKQDVQATYECAMAMREEITNWPNRNLFDKDGHSCPTCGSHAVTGNGYRATKSGLMKRYRCNDCGSSSTAPNDKKILRSL